jgi:hypothetical protein
MNRDQILEVITHLLDDEVGDLEARIDQAVARKPVPPFLPPPIWTAGRHPGTTVVRHCNGLFMARRDTDAEPPHEDWLPLVVGVAGLDLRWTGDRTMAMRARLSDGTQYETIRTLAIPIVRGYWSADADYEEGDRVFRYGEFHALQASRGIEPGIAGSDDHWLKVGGKSVKDRRAFALSDDGELTESGHVIGSFKPLIAELLDDLVARHTR